MSDSLKQLGRDLQQFAEVRDWEQFHTPKNLSMALIAEAAELIEHFQWLTPEQSETLSEQTLEEVRMELADIQIYLLRIAQRLDIDLVGAVRDKMALNEQRFPVDTVHGKAGKPE